MTLSSSELTFSPTPATLVFGVALVLVTAVLSFIIWKTQPLFQINRAAGTAPTSDCHSRRGHIEPTRMARDLRTRRETRRCGAVGSLEKHEHHRCDFIRRTAIGSRCGDATKSSPNWSRRKNGRDPGWMKTSNSFSNPFLPGSIHRKMAPTFSSALDDLAEQHPNLRGVVLISDGDWNDGEPPARAATRLRMKRYAGFCPAHPGATRACQMSKSPDSTCRLSLSPGKNGAHSFYADKRAAERSPR